MSFASDIITYAGVPLAILGVLPLIWNLIASIYVWRRLRASLPTNANGFFKLGVDPVAGAVKCSFFEAQLRYQKLRNKIGTEITTLGRVQIDDVEDYLLGASWMGLLSVKGLIEADGSSYPKQFIVDRLMDCKFIGFRCDWPTFVYLVLALGVSPLDENILSLKNGPEEHWTQAEGFTLQSDTSSGEIKVTCRNSIIARLSSNTTERLKFSWRRALAWHLVMAPVEEGSRGQLVSLFPPKASRITESTQDDLLYTPIGLSDSSQISFNDAEPRMGPSLTWAFYVEEVLDHPDEDQRELLPVPPDVLNCRNKAIEDLHRLREDGNLEPRIKSLFSQEGALWDHVSMSLNSELEAAVQNNARRKIRNLLANHPIYEEIKRQFRPCRLPESRCEQRDTFETVSTERDLMARLSLLVSPISAWKGTPWRKRTNAWGVDEFCSPLGSLFRKSGHTPVLSEVYFG